MLLLTFSFRACGFGKTIQILRFQPTGGRLPEDGVKQMNQMEETGKTVYNIGSTKQIQFF